MNEIRTDYVKRPFARLAGAAPWLLLIGIALAFAGCAGAGGGKAGSSSRTGVAGTILVIPSAVRDCTAIAAPPVPGVLVEPPESLGAVPT